MRICQESWEKVLKNKLIMAWIIASVLAHIFAFFDPELAFNPGHAEAFSFIVAIYVDFSSRH
jgi:hypothetical protein